MKSLLRVVAVSTALMGLVGLSAMPASAVTTDTLLGSATLENSGDSTQLAGLASLLGIPISNLTLTDKQDVHNLTQDGNQFILNVAPEEPGYFILKFGVGNLNVPNTYFFQNIAELSLLVFENYQVNDLINPNDLPGETRLSHYALVNGPVSAIPLPASLPLLLAGLAGLGAVSRRSRAA